MPKHSSNSMTQQQQPTAEARAFTDEEREAFVSCIERLKQRNDMDVGERPFDDFQVNVLFYLWQQATRDAQA